MLLNIKVWTVFIKMPGNSSNKQQWSDIHFSPQPKVPERRDGVFQTIVPPTSCLTSAVTRSDCLLGRPGTSRNRNCSLLVSACSFSASVILTTFSELRALRQRVIRRKGRTNTVKIGMKARMRRMTTMRATRAMRRARGKRKQVTRAPQ